MWKQIDGFQNYEISDKGEVGNIQNGLGCTNREMYHTERKESE